MTTSDYLLGISSGDPAVLRELYRSVFPLIRKMIGGQGGTEDDARDVFQEATVVLYTQAKTPGFSIAVQFNTYFTAVCRNLWLNRRTKKSASDVTISEDVKLLADEPDPEFDHLAIERRQVFDTAFLQLGEDCRRLMRMFFDKIPMSEIAVQMGFASEGYARRRKFQCKDRLVELVKKQPRYLELIDG